MARSVVDLPAPFAPMSVTISPWPERQRDALQRLDRAVGDAQVADLEHRLERHRPRRKRHAPPGTLRSPSGLRWISAGFPTAIVEP